MFLIVQMVGDRGNGYYSFKDIAFCIPANPMSDRGQLVIVYEDEKADTCSRQGENRRREKA